MTDLQPRTVARRRSWLPLVAVLFALLLGGTVAKLVADASRQRQVAAAALSWERHTLDVIIESQNLLIALQDAQSGLRGVLVIGTPAYRTIYEDGRRRVLAGLDNLRRMVADNPGQEANVDRLDIAANDRLAELGVSLAQSDAANGDSSRAAIVRADRGKPSMDAARAAVADIVAAERRMLLVRRQQADTAAAATSGSIAQLSIIGALLAAATLGATVLAWRNRRMLRREARRRQALEADQARDAELARIGALVTAIGDASPDLIYAKDRDGRMTYANPATLAVIGRSWSEVEGRTEYDFAIDRSQADTIRALDAGIMASGETRIIDEVFTSPDGRTRVLRATKSPLRDAAGTVIGIAGVTIDVTQQRSAEAALMESEARFRSLSETLPAFVYVADANGYNVYTNRVFQDYIGSDPDSLLGRGWKAFVHPDDIGPVTTAWRAAIAAKSIYAASYRFRRHDGVWRWFQVRGTPVLDTDGNILEWVGAGTDTQDLFDARDALAHANAELEERVAARTASLRQSLDELERESADRLAAEAQVRQLQKMESIGQLTGGIAHDFNNMLGIVVASLDLAKRRLPTDPAKTLQGIEFAEEGARRAAQLTARLLAFSRQQPLEPQPLTANKLVSNMSELLQRSLGEGVRIETVLAGGLWQTFTDAAQLENAIVNLAVNARDAMAGDGRLTIETANSHLDDDYARANPGTAPGQYVMIAVTDTGTGMSPETAARAFDPFFTTKGVGAGTGLGLSQVYGFVKQSGGHIKIYSEPGAGTTIRLYLPRYTGGGDDALPVAADGTTLPMARPGETILVVEDDPGVRATSIALLAELGYGVREAADGEAALRILAGDTQLTMMMTDIVMPGINGRILADRAAELRPDLPVLFVTGYTRNAVVHNGMVDAGVAFLAKPFTLAALAAKVRGVIDAAV